jgi:hypothetical protein
MEIRDGRLSPGEGEGDQHKRGERAVPSSFLSDSGDAPVDPAADAAAPRVRGVVVIGPLIRRDPVPRRLQGEADGA